MAADDLRPATGEAPGKRRRPALPAGAARKATASLVTDAVAGLTTAIVLVGNIVAFSALMFPGQFSGGITVALWAMLLGSAITGVWIALKTSIPPLASGIDTPTGAVLVVLAGTITTGVTAAGGSPASAVTAALLSFTLVTLLSGAALLLLGWLRLGYLFRFVPYSVVGGFLAATGWFLIVGGYRVATGHSVTLAQPFQWLTGVALLKVVLAVVTAAAMLRARAVFGTPFAVPGVLIGFCVAGELALHLLGLTDPKDGWYIKSQFDLVGWSPIKTSSTRRFHGRWCSPRFPRSAQRQPSPSCRW